MSDNNIVNSLDNRVQSLDKKVDKTIESTNSKFEKIQITIGDINAVNKANETNTKNLEKTMVKLETRFDILESSNTLLNDKVDNLENNLSKLNDKVDSLPDIIKSANDQNLKSLKEMLASEKLEKTLKLYKMGISLLVIIFSLSLFGISYQLKEEAELLCKAISFLTPIILKPAFSNLDKTLRK